jgi:hypothetical protein
MKPRPIDECGLQIGDCIADCRLLIGLPIDDWIAD